MSTPFIYKPPSPFDLMVYVRQEVLQIHGLVGNTIQEDVLKGLDVLQALMGRPEVLGAVNFDYVLVNIITQDLINLLGDDRAAVASQACNVALDIINKLGNVKSVSFVNRLLPGLFAGLAQAKPAEVRAAADQCILTLLSQFEFTLTFPQIFQTLEDGDPVSRERSAFYLQQGVQKCINEGVDFDFQLVLECISGPLKDVNPTVRQAAEQTLISIYRDKPTKPAPKPAPVSSALFQSPSPVTVPAAPQPVPAPHAPVLNEVKPPELTMQSAPVVAPSSTDKPESQAAPAAASAPAPAPAATAPKSVTVPPTKHSEAKSNSATPAKQHSAAKSTATPAKQPESKAAPTPAKHPEAKVTSTPAKKPEAKAVPTPAKQAETKAAPAPAPAKQPEAKATSTLAKQPEAKVTPAPAKQPEVKSVPTPAKQPEAKAAPAPKPAPEKTAPKSSVVVKLTASAKKALIAPPSTAKVAQAKSTDPTDPTQTSTPTVHTDTPTVDASPAAEPEPEPSVLPAPSTPAQPIENLKEPATPEHEASPTAAECGAEPSQENASAPEVEPEASAPATPAVAPSSNLTPGETLTAEALDENSPTPKPKKPRVAVSLIPPSPWDPKLAPVAATSALSSAATQDSPSVRRSSRFVETPRTGKRRRRQDSDEFEVESLSSDDDDDEESVSEKELKKKKRKRSDLVREALNAELEQEIAGEVADEGEASKSEESSKRSKVNADSVDSFVPTTPSRGRGRGRGGLRGRPRGSRGRTRRGGSFVVSVASPSPAATESTVLGSANEEAAAPDTDEPEVESQEPKESKESKDPVKELTRQERHEKRMSSEPPLEEMLLSVKKKRKELVWLEKNLERSKKHKLDDTVDAESSEEAEETAPAKAPAAKASEVETPSAAAAPVEASEPSEQPPQPDISAGATSSTDVDAMQVDQGGQQVVANADNAVESDDESHYLAAFADAATLIAAQGSDDEIGLFAAAAAADGNNTDSESIDETDFDPVVGMDMTKCPAITIETPFFHYQTHSARTTEGPRAIMQWSAQTRELETVSINLPEHPAYVGMLHWIEFNLKRAPKTLANLSHVWEARSFEWKIAVLSELVRLRFHFKTGEPPSSLSAYVSNTSLYGWEGTFSRDTPPARLPHLGTRDVFATLSRYPGVDIKFKGHGK